MIKALLLLLLLLSHFSDVAAADGPEMRTVCSTRTVVRRHVIAGIFPGSSTTILLILCLCSVQPN